MSLGVLCYGDKILEGEIEYGKLGLFSPQPIRLFLLMDPSFPLLNTSIMSARSSTHKYQSAAIGE